MAKNLFHRAISESGVVITPGLFTTDVRTITEVGPRKSLHSFLKSSGVFPAVGFSYVLKQFLK